jgi:4-hydroxy-tetrahydrodipicolinate reductase
VVLYGVGAIGSNIAKFLLEKEGIEIVGAIDNARDKAGKDLGEVLQIDKLLRIVVSDDFKKTLSRSCCDVVIHSTSSYLKEVYPQIAPLAEYDVDVVSTCEELSYPFVSEPELAKKLDILCKKYGVTFLGTGINPGYLMDTLVIMLTGVCQKVDKISVERVINAGTRRVPFQKKIGAGLSVSEFKKKIEEKAITGHVGLEQSIGMVASALCWELDKIEADSVEPVIAVKSVRSDAIKVKEGYVAGLRQKAIGIKKHKDVITLDFQAYIGAEEEYDAIRIDGVPPINQKITPCVHGDLATVAVIVNSIPKLMNAAPGLVTMKDLPIVSAAVEDMRKYVYGFTGLSK